jgi:hypothetical protein
MTDLDMSQLQRRLKRKAAANSFASASAAAFPRRRSGDCRSPTKSSAATRPIRWLTSKNTPDAPRDSAAPHIVAEAVTAGARLPRHKGFEATRPPDLSNAQWQAALRGLQTFVAGGWGDQAEALGWTRDELYRAPELWARADLCGAALLVGANEVIAVTPTEIRIKTA